MNDLIAADAWLHNVFHSGISLETCEKRFMMFGLEGDLFIRDQIVNEMIPFAEQHGYFDTVESYHRILEILDKCIEKKK